MYTAWKLRIMFYIVALLRTTVQGEISNSCEELFQRGKGGVRVYRRPWWGKKKKKKSNIKNLLLITKTRYLKLVIRTLFYVWEGITVWAYWSHSFDTHLNYLGPVSCFSILNSPQGALLEELQWLKTLWLKHSSYMKWQEAFFVHKQKLRRRPQVWLEREVYFSSPWDAPTCWVMEMENSCLQKCLSSITDLCPTWAGEAVSEWVISESPGIWTLSQLLPTGGLFHG